MPRPDVAVVSLAAGEVMGQQVYEQALESAGAGAGGLRLRHVRVRSLRSRLPGDLRLPLSALDRLPLAGQHALGLAYGRARLVHRCDLRLPPRPGREVLTVHDTAWVHFDDEAVPARHHAEGARRAEAVVVPSAFAGDEVVQHLGVDRERVHVIPNGVDPAFLEPGLLSEGNRASLGLTGPYLLHGGGCSRRKNLSALAEAWTLIAAARPELQLALTGPPDPRRDALFTPLPRVRLLGRLPRQEQVALVAAAACVVVPSVYEGFGYPVLEAAAVGTPVVAAARASLPEVAPGVARLSEPTGTAIAEAVLDALAAARPPARAVRTAADSAAEHLALYRALLRV